MIIGSNKFGLFRRNRFDPNRPVIRPEMEPVDWLIEGLALGGLLFFAGYAIFNYHRIPLTIPTHFDGSGRADEFGDRSSFLILPGIALFIYALMTLINLIPHTFNFAVKITPANALRQYKLATRMVRTLKTSLVWVFWYISYSTIEVANERMSGMGVWFLPISLGFILGPLIFYIIMALRK